MCAVKMARQAIQATRKCDTRRKRCWVGETVVIGHNGQRPITLWPPAWPQGQEDMQEARSYDQKADYGSVGGNDYARKVSVGDLGN